MQKNFKFPSPSLVLNTLYNVHNKERNNEFVNMLESGLSDLKNDIEKKKKKLKSQIER